MSKFEHKASRLHITYLSGQETVPAATNNVGMFVHLAVEKMPQDFYIGTVPTQSGMVKVTIPNVGLH